MIKTIKSEKNFNKTPVQEIWHNDGDQVLAYMRGDLLLCSTSRQRARLQTMVFLYQQVLTA